MKQVVSLSAVLILSLLLAACGSNPATPTTAPVSPTTAAQPGPSTQPTVASQPEPTVAPTVASAPAGVSFANDVQPILNSRCISCHGVDDLKEGLDLRTYASIMAGSTNGPVVAAGDPANSPLYSLVANNKMPKRGPKLTPAQVQMIMDWIDLGAPNN